MQLVTPYDNEDKGSFSAGDVNSALMELGASLCAPSGTGLDPVDPLKDFYFSTQIGREVGLHIIQNTSAPSSTYTSLEDSNQLLHQLLSSSQQNTSDCKLCDSNGIAIVLQKIVQSIEREQKRGPLDSDRLSCIGHSAFPTAPPKLKKREEILAIAAISIFDSSSSMEKWLMVKRPSDGLLAGQWEFPSVCLWVSNKNDDGKVGGGTSSIPFVDSSVVKGAVDLLLGEVINRTAIDDSIKSRILQCSSTWFCDQPINHIFSHVRHIMWIEHRRIKSEACVSGLFKMGKQEWKTLQGTDIRWMTEEEMRSVGITAGILKVLAAVKTKRPKLDV